MYIFLHYIFGVIFKKDVGGPAHNMNPLPPNVCPLIANYYVDDVEVQRVTHKPAIIKTKNTNKLNNLHARNKKNI